ncbi:microfibril-associated glycoprotein 4-like [Clupea harengus]|uniref:Microfibril-associated glycoprotein 4-like n=1 Tax=Clupea harengus TaxID=7950 RepID=A0A6P8EP99_CLUHA|nr:microfibril-associated glycoprotein 4-like [Clupea harengus]
MMVYWSLALLLPLLVQSLPITEEDLPIDCEDVFRNGSIHNGVYTIYPVGQEVPMEVYCDMGCTDNENHQSHWTVIMRRMDGTVNFDRPYSHYEEGFGNKNGEYWLGLQNMHLLTYRTKYMLRVDMEDFEGGKVYALYGTFFLESESDGYRLRVIDFSNGGAGDSLANHNGQRFSTFDRDQDAWYWGQCNQDHKWGGFWFHHCTNANTNGRYQWKNYRVNDGSGLNWSGWTVSSLKAISMKVRRLSLDD